MRIILPRKKDDDEFNKAMEMLEDELNKKEQCPI